MTLAGGDRQDLRHLVGVMSQDAPLELGKERLAGFDDELDLPCPFSLPLPAIDGGEPWQLIDAGGEALVEQLLADEVGTGFIRAGAEHQNGVGHGVGGLVSGGAKALWNSGYYTGQRGK